MRNPVVLRPGKSPRTVKNLGWVLHNAHRVVALGFTRTSAHPLPTYEFCATLGDGTVYISPYASYGVFVNWVNRPRFWGLPLRIVDQTNGGECVMEGTVGQDTFRAVPWS
jgi:hypothetical protein